MRIAVIRNVSENEDPFLTSNNLMDCRTLVFVL